MESRVVYTADTASYVRAGFDTQQASVGFPFAAASFEREHKERQAAASHKKQLQMIGRWHYPRVLLKLKECATASERFKTAIRNALSTYDKNKDINPLRTVFEQYGTVVPNEVTLGGELFFVHTEDYQGSVNEHEVEEVIKAAVSIKTATKAEGSVGASFQNAQGSKVTGDGMSKVTQFTVRGGDTTLASNPQQWPTTVKPASNWTVIGRAKLTSIIEWLPEDLRSRVMTVWPMVPVPPAIWEGQEVPAEQHSARTDSDAFIFGVRTNYAFNVGMSGKGVRGGLEFVCGPSGSPALGQPDAVGASTTFNSWHGERRGDSWIDGASICLPVPKGRRYSVKTWDDDRGEGGAYSRFQTAETNLTFGKWQTLADRPGFTGAGKIASGAVDSDRFIFCSVRAPDVGDRGFVSCTVDEKILGAASVHNAPGDAGGCWSPHACFCVPVPRHLPMSIETTVGYGKLDIKAWSLASTSQGWKFGSPEQYTLDAWHTAETDGFLNGVVTVQKGNGMLLLHCGPDQGNIARQSVIPAMMAVHQTTNRFIPYASAMLPIRKGFVFRPSVSGLSQDPGHSPATVEAYWTPLHPE